MKTLALMIALTAAPPQQELASPLVDAQAFRQWCSEHGWGLWGAAVLSTGISGSLFGGSFLLTAAEDQPGLITPAARAQQQSLLYTGGAIVAFAAGAILTAIAMFVYQSASTAHEDAYWETTRF